MKLLIRDKKRKCLRAQVRINHYFVMVRIPVELSREWLEYVLLMASRGYSPIALSEYVRFLKKHSQI